MRFSKFIYFKNRIFWSRNEENKNGKGGNDHYNNLVYITKDAHKLIHATQPETINKYLKLISINENTVKYINDCRGLVDNFEICL